MKINELIYRIVNSDTAIVNIEEKEFKALIYIKDRLSSFKQIDNNIFTELIHNINDISISLNLYEYEENERQVIYESLADFNKYNQYLNSNDIVSELELVIEIVKPNNILLVLSPEHFFSMLCSKPFNDICSVFESFISENNTSLVVFKFIDNISIKTKSGLISSEFLSDVDFHKRPEILNKYRDNSTTIQKYLKLIPYDFHLETPTKIDFIDNFFNSMSNVISVIFISSKTEIEDDALNIMFKGYKITNYRIKDVFAKISNYFFKTYDWAYNDGSVSDKLQIIRNIISLNYSNENEVINEQIYRIIIDNYDFYLKLSVQQYLDALHKSNELIDDNFRKFNATQNEFTGNIKKIIFGLFTYLITIVSIVFFKERLAIIQNAWYFLILTLIIFTLTELFRNFTKKNFRTELQQFSKYFLKQISKYDLLFSLSENKFRQDLLEENKTINNNTVKNYSRYDKLWMILNYFIIIITIMSMLCLGLKYYCDYLISEIIGNISIILNTV